MPAAEIAGVDLSKWQGEVDFAKIKQAGKTYAFIKATQGNRDIDPDYASNMRGARRWPGRRQLSLLHDRRQARGEASSSPAAQRFQVLEEPDGPHASRRRRRLTETP